MTFDAANLNRKAIREALELIAAHQGGIARAGKLASSSPTRKVLNEAARVRAQLIDAADRAGKAGLGSAQENVARQAATQVEYVRRAVAPLSVDQLTRELAWVLRSDSTVGAKLVATEIVREQAELRAVRGQRPAPNRAVAERLLAQARRTLDDAQAGSDDDPPPPPQPPSEGDQAGIDDLIAAIQEEGEQTRKTLREEGEKTRETIEGAGRSRGKIGLLLSLAGLLVSCATLYLQTQKAPPPPSRPAGESTLKIQGPVVPPPAGPLAGGLRLGPPFTHPPDAGRSLSGSVSLRTR